MYKKRFQVCISGGLLSAVLCLAGKQIVYGFPDITMESVAMTVANRILLGFVIGISCWRINYLFHGALMGLFVSLSVSIGFAGNIFGFFLYTSAGVVYGIMIEWITSVMFKCPMRIQHQE